MSFFSPTTEVTETKLQLILYLKHLEFLLPVDISSIPSWTETVAPHDCSPPYAFTGRDILVKENDLSERQAMALGYILEKGSLTIKDYEAMCPEVNRRTLQRDLKAMIDKGVLKSEGATHHQEYRLN